jgi:hypothetical protein
VFQKGLPPSNVALTTLIVASPAPETFVNVPDGAGAPLEKVMAILPSPDVSIFVSAIVYVLLFLSE